MPFINKMRKARPGVYNDLESHMPDVNKAFINACKNGDYHSVISIIDAIPKFNIDLTDNLGKNVLKLAIENEHLETVEVLLDKSDIHNLKDALLLAIYLDHTQIAETIIRHPKYIKHRQQLMKRDLDSFYETKSEEGDSQFSPDITPLMLASQYNRVRIVQILYELGDRINKPHSFHCECPNCSNRLEFDSLRHTQSRLNSYKALASESYISFASEDPILTAFELGHELRMLSTKEKCFKNDYLQLADNLSVYVCKLLNFVRGESELRKVLNKSGKENEEIYSFKLKEQNSKETNTFEQFEEYEYESLERLNLAIKYKEKLFVAHPNCQQKLEEIWLRAIKGYSNRFIKSNKVYGYMLIFFYILFLPFTAPLYIIMPKSKFTKFANEPFVKFLAHTFMCVIFIVLITCISFISFNVSPKQKFKDSVDTDLHINICQFLLNIKDQNYTYYTDFYLREDQLSPPTFAVLVFITGFIVFELNSVLSLGLKSYFASYKNIMLTTMNLLYLLYFILQLFSVLMVKSSKSKINERNWNLSNASDYSEEDIINDFYWLNADRFYYEPFDPLIVADCLFAIANLLSVFRLFFLLPAAQSLGPLQISLRYMLSDFTKFLGILLIILLAFLISLNNLLKYFKERKSYELNINHLASDMIVEEHFSSTWQSFKTMLSALFGIGDYKDTEFRVEENSREKFSTAIVTETICFFLYFFYRVVVIIFLLNMLVASMTQSYERIFEKSDTEWKFARSELYMEYIKEGNAVPVPFNILLVPKYIFESFKSVLRYIKKYPKKNQENSISNNHDPKTNGTVLKHDSEKTNQINDDLTYEKIIQRILIRFLLEKERQSDEIGEGDFGELKQDLQAIRFEMLSYLKQTRDDSLRLINLFNGTSLRGEEVFKNFKSDPLAHLNMNKNDKSINLNETDKDQIIKTGSNETSSDVNSSSASSETGTGDSNTGSSVSNSSDSLSSNGTYLSEVSLFTASIMNENHKFNPKNYTFYELDIIKEEDGHF